MATGRNGWMCMTTYEIYEGPFPKSSKKEKRNTCNTYIHWPASQTIDFIEKLIHLPTCETCEGLAIRFIRVLKWRLAINTIHMFNIITVLRWWLAINTIHTFKIMAVLGWWLNLAILVPCPWTWGLSSITTTIQWRWNMLNLFILFTFPWTWGLSNMFNFGIFASVPPVFIFGFIGCTNPWSLVQSVVHMVCMQI